MAKCAAALQSDSMKYKAAINVFAVDALRLPMPGVPISRSAVTRLREHHFGAPAPLPLDIVVGVASADAAKAAMDGQLCRQVSAPELLFAYFDAIGLAIKKADEGLLVRWAQTALCCPCCFVKLESEDEYHRLSIQFREDISQAFTTMRFTAVQKMFDVQQLKERKEETTGAVSAERLAAYYAEGVRFADNSEKMTFEFIDCSLTVLNRLMSLPRCAKLVLSLEDYGAGNPLDSIYKLHRIITRASTPEKIEWSLELMVDLWTAGALNTDQLSLRHLDGRGLKGADGKGLVDMLCFKRDVLLYVLGDFLDSRRFSPEQKQRLKEVCASIDVFRSKCGYMFNAKHRKAASLGWLGLKRFVLAPRGPSILAAFWSIPGVGGMEDEGGTRKGRGMGRGRGKTGRSCPMYYVHRMHGTSWWLCPPLPFAASKGRWCTPPSHMIKKPLHHQRNKTMRCVPSGICPA